jgi:hypothetical protein
VDAATIAQLRVKIQHLEDALVAESKACESAKESARVLLAQAKVKAAKHDDIVAKLHDNDVLPATPPRATSPVFGRRFVCPVEMDSPTFVEAKTMDALVTPPQPFAAPSDVVDALLADYVADDLLPSDDDDWLATPPPAKPPVCGRRFVAPVEMDTPTFVQAEKVGDLVTPLLDVEMGEAPVVVSVPSSIVAPLPPANVALPVLDVAMDEAHVVISVPPSIVAYAPDADVALSVLAEVAMNEAPAVVSAPPPIFSGPFVFVPAPPSVISSVPSVVGAATPVGFGLIPPPTKALLDAMNAAAVSSTSNKTLEDKYNSNKPPSTEEEIAARPVAVWRPCKAKK